MIWFSKINSQAFKDWLISSGGGHSIRPGKSMDPFGSSMRRFNNAHAWMIQIAGGGALSLTSPRTTDQAVIDLRSAHLLEQSKISLSTLGIRTLNDWKKYNIPASDENYEIHRCLLLINNALKLKDNYYQNFLNYWEELRKSYSFSHLITNPELLYFFSYFNKELNGFNPYDVIKGLKMTDVDFSSAIDWDKITNYYNDAALTPIIIKYKTTIDGIVARQGRTNFVAALELIKNSSSLSSVISSLGITAGNEIILREIINGLENYNMPALNQILYGPPGTGKTHNSINHALAIINGSDVNNMIAEQNKDPSLREAAKKEFDELVKKGQIQFVTFHQSYSYEDFVEGIKSVVNANGMIEYRVEDGIFKNICTEAGKKGAPSVSFDDAYDLFTQEVQDSGGTFTLKTPIQKKDFAVKISSLGNAVAVPKTEDATEMTISKNNLKGYVEHGVVKDWKPYTTAIGDYIKNKYLLSTSGVLVDNSDKNYVLIIDEINRGNISKIFGELITLIEKSKRIGEPEELRVKLTYSGADSLEDFGVPSNLYIIGTMNSADKSISLVDTALRRRFEFFEYSGDCSILNTNVDGINLQELLSTINSRIEILLDKDHKIGHAYFVNVNSKNELCAVFRNKIIPLLEEYFYSDYEKIQLVLGDNPEFNKSSENKIIFGNTSSDQRKLFGKDIDGFEEKTIYQINSNFVHQKFDDISSQVFISIYTKTPLTS